MQLAKIWTRLGTATQALSVMVFLEFDTPTVRTSNSDDSPVARLALVSKDGANVDVKLWDST